MRPGGEIGPISRRWSTVILSAMFLVVCPAAFLSYFYLRSKTEYFTQRKLRMLALLSDQIRQVVENHAHRQLPGGGYFSEDRVCLRNT